MHFSDCSEDKTYKPSVALPSILSPDSAPSAPALPHPSDDVGQSPPSLTSPKKKRGRPLGSHTEHNEEDELDTRDAAPTLSSQNLELIKQLSARLDDAERMASVSSNAHMQTIVMHQPPAKAYVFTSAEIA